MRPLLLGRFRFVEFRMVRVSIGGSQVQRERGRQIGFQSIVIRQGRGQPAETVREFQLPGRKQVAARIRGHRPDGLQFGKGHQPLHELAATRVAQQIIRHLLTTLDRANLLDQLGDDAESPLILGQHDSLGQNVAVIIHPAGELLLIEERRHDQSAALVAQRRRRDRGNYRDCGRGHERPPAADPWRASMSWADK